MGSRADSRSAVVEEAADRLYGVPLSRFTAERKELAAALRKAGDRASATVIGELPRPSMSAWVINRLYREAKDDLEALFSAARKMRRGQLDAAEEHREQLGKLRARAASILVGDNHAASEPTLRRVATTLQALSAQGSFAPDPPGQLVADRDPPGFEVMAELAASLPAADDSPAAERRERASARREADRTRDDDDGDARESEARREEEARRRRAKARAEEIERASADLNRIERELAEARRILDARSRDVNDAEERVRRAEQARDQAQTRVAELDDQRARASARLAEVTEDQQSSR